MCKVTNGLSPFGILNKKPYFLPLGLENSIHFKQLSMYRRILFFMSGNQYTRDIFSITFRKPTWPISSWHVRITLFSIDFGT
jgi:hypothetical protein